MHGHQSRGSHLVRAGPVESNLALAARSPAETMEQPTPPKLTIPASSASPSAASANTQTGRPPLWTKSAQRKMTRLYVYTTLPLDTIVKLVHCRTPDSAPG